MVLLLRNSEPVLYFYQVKNWVKYAKFEEKHHYINSARKIYERAVDFFGEDNMDEKLLIAFAKFEEAQKEVGICFTFKVKPQGLCPYFLTQYFDSDPVKVLLCT